MAPILIQAIPGQLAPAYLAAIAASAAALWIARRRISELARPSAVERPYVIATAIWAFGIILVTVGVTWIGSGWDNPLRWGLIIGGLAILGLALLRERRHRGQAVVGVHIERVPVAIAIFAGVVLAVSQTAAMLQLPLYFRVVLGFGPLLATVAVAPLFASLVLAGPIAGFLLQRFSPRWLVGVGVAAVGAGDLLVALLATPTAGYIAFVIPCILVGAGFVIATTVRTAIVFSSVPRGLPATAAALNESSISVGSRIGIVLVTAVVAETALASYATATSSLPPAEAKQAMAAFRDLLTVIGTPSFASVASAIDAADMRPYVEAYAAGVQWAMALSGIIAMVAGAVAWIALGDRDPLDSVWEHRDEREVATA